MSTDPEIPVEGDYDVFDQHSMMKMFDELSFRQKWTRVGNGLKQPKESGEHKWAKLQLIRLLSPLLALIVPVLMLFLIAVLSKFTPEPNRSVEVTIMEPKPLEELEEIEPPEIEKLEPPEPVEVEVDVSADAPSLPNEAISTATDAASVQPAEFDSVAQVKSPVVMAGIMGSRNPGSRGAALGRYGGGHTVKSVLRALRFLAKTQNEDGSWNKNKPAMTALALLAYLAHGDTPASEEFGRTVEKAIKYLVDAQESNGRFKGRDGHDYTQPIVAYALAEAYGMTKVPMVKEAAIKAIEVVVKGQNSTGSFDYGLKPGGTGRDDLSYAGWCVQALKAAKIAGLMSDVPGIKEAMKKSIDGVKGHFKGASYEGSEAGIFGYSRGGGGSQGLTGVGVLCLQFLGDSKAREVRMGMIGMQRHPFSWVEPENNGQIYYWYYITQAYFQEGGAAWDKWNKEFSGPLCAAQDVISKDESGYVDHEGNPHEIGSWISPAVKEHNGSNPVMDTILSTLMLEVYYRYLPTFQQVPEEEIEQELGDEQDLVIEIVQTRPDVRSVEDTDIELMAMAQ